MGITLGKKELHHVIAMLKGAVNSMRRKEYMPIEGTGKLYVSENIKLDYEFEVYTIGGNTEMRIETLQYVDGEPISITIDKEYVNSIKDVWYTYHGCVGHIIRVNKK